MSNLIRHKKSGIAGKKPQLSDLDAAEILFNYKDGVLYGKKISGGIETVVEFHGSETPHLLSKIEPSLIASPAAGYVKLFAFEDELYYMLESGNAIRLASGNPIYSFFAGIIHTDEWLVARGNYLTNLQRLIFSFTTDGLIFIENEFKEDTHFMRFKLRDILSNSILANVSSSDRPPREFRIEPQSVLGRRASDIENIPISELGGSKVWVDHAFAVISTNTFSVTDSILLNNLKPGMVCRVTRQGATGYFYAIITAVNVSSNVVTIAGCYFSGTIVKIEVCAIDNKVALQFFVPGQFSIISTTDLSFACNRNTTRWGNGRAQLALVYWDVSEQSSSSGCALNIRINGNRALYSNWSISSVSGSSLRVDENSSFIEMGQKLDIEVVTTIADPYYAKNLSATLIFILE